MRAAGGGAGSDAAVALPSQGITHTNDSKCRLFSLNDDIKGRLCFVFQAMEIIRALQVIHLSLKFLSFWI